MPTDHERRLSGQPVSPGIAMGILRVEARGCPAPPARSISPTQLESEWQRFEAALTRTEGELNALKQRVESISGAAEAVVVERATGRTLATAELSERTLTLYGAERLDGEWRPISNSRTDPNGGWSANRLRSFKFIRAAIEE